MTRDVETRLTDSLPPSTGPDLVRLRTTLARRAADERPLDVAYGSYDSPLGPLTLIVTPRGLVRLSYPGEGIADQLDELAERVSPRILEVRQRGGDRASSRIARLEPIALWEAEPFGCLDRWPGQADAVDFLALEQLRGLRHRKPGLAGTGGADSEHPLMAF